MRLTQNLNAAGVQGEGKRRGKEKGGKREEKIAKVGLTGAPTRIRTWDLPLRRGTLYPAELWGRHGCAL
jgi:hypothetical protein